MTGPVNHREAVRLLGEQREDVVRGSTPDMSLLAEAQVRATLAVHDVIAAMLVPCRFVIGSAAEDTPLTGHPEQPSEWPLWTVVQGDTPGDPCHCVWINNGEPGEEWQAVQVTGCAAHAVGCQYSRDDLPLGLAVLADSHRGGTA